MEARSQLRHRPTLSCGEMLLLNSRLASSSRQTRLQRAASTRIGLLKTSTLSEPMFNSQNFLVQTLFFLITSLIACLTPTRAGAQESPSSPTGAQPPVAYASVNELNGILTPLQQTSQSMLSDLTKVRIEKWKTDASTKQQTMATAESIRRNLQTALPETITELKNTPEDLGTSFKLYRNLVLLYDYFYQVVESEGAFGPKDDFQSLNNDLNGLDNARRAFADRMQKLAAGKEDELTRLRAQVKTLTAAPPPPPKKIVVDDTEPPKKPVKKKVTKPKPPATTPATPADTPPSTAPSKQ
jgi:hypothetical protein